MVDRRKFLALSLIGLYNTFVPSYSFSETINPLQINKIIPKTGELLPSIGMGTWITFDIGYNTDEVNKRAEIVRNFFSNGGSLIDSSPMYGSAEKVLGLCLEKITKPKKLFSATKVWTPINKHGEQQIENSYRLWKLNYFSLIQVHNLVNYKEHLKKLRELKEQKKLKYIGVTTSHGNKHKLLIDILNNEDIDFVQFTYNVLDDEAEKILLPLAQEKKIAVIINRPFQGGSLFNHIIGKKIPTWLNSIGIYSWPEFFLKFITSHPAVTCAIPATSRLDHMKENMKSLFGNLPNIEERAKMKSLYKTYI